ARGAARYVRSLIPGALSILKGAVPGRARGLGHMAPTYFRREPGIATPTAERLRTFVRMNQPAAVESLKAQIRRDAAARRDALPAAERAAAAVTIAARPLPVAVRPGAVVSGFSPLKSEINPVPLMRAFAAAGAARAPAGGGGPGKAADPGGVDFRRAPRLRRLGHPRPPAERARSVPRRPDRADARLRPQRPPYRLRRRLLRHDDRAIARHE